MSISDFTSALASRAYREWFARLTPNIIKQSSSSLRGQYEENANINNFLITDEKIRDMAAYVTDGRVISDEEITNIKNRMMATLANVKNAGVTANIKDYGVLDPKRGQEIVFENVNFQTIESLLNSGFSKEVLKDLKRSVGSGFHRGHVYGLPTVLLNETISKLEQAEIPDDQVGGIIGRGKNLTSMLVNILKAYRTELQQQDLLSSNMGSAGSSYIIYANYSKDPTQFLIEMQVNLTNTASGRQAGKTLTELKKFLNPEKINAGLINKVLSSIQKPSTILNFLKDPGSPPWITLVGNQLANAIDLTNKSRDVKKYKIPFVEIATNKISLKRSSKDIQLHKKELQKADKIIRELENLKSKERTIRSSRTTNLTSLQRLLDAALVQQVKQNMGRGDRRDVLNLRTGRFAESVKVERLSESRQGMITAFYSYMRNPYATFSAGGRQETPKTRDPKLLIAKSIREIAAQAVTNRLRAVNV